MNTLTNKLSDLRKLNLLLEHLERGYPFTTTAGMTLVWLDNHIVRTEMDDQGKEQYFVIDGLAQVYEKVAPDGTTSPHYVGRSDMTVDALSRIACHMTEEQLLGLAANAALAKTVKKR